MKKLNIKNKIIQELCEENGIKKTVISYDWITILKKDNIEKKLVNYKLDINSAISEKIANDKYSTYEVLKHYDIPVVEHKVLFNEKIMPECAYINDNFNILKNNEKMVIKVNDSSQGKGVFLCENEKQKLKLMKEIFECGEDAISVCPYLEIDAEYRVFCLNGKTEYIYKKQKPFVIGNGNLNVKELISKNLLYLTEISNEVDLNYVPVENEKIIVGWKHNLSQGAIPKVVNEDDIFYKDVINIAEKAVTRIGLRLAAIDVAVTNLGEVLIMEVNPNFGVAKFCEKVPEGYEIIKNIYRKVINKMFEGEENEIKK